ncbi:MAG: AAA family ATPase [Thermodesulfobacteriota bacterium]|nr:AAA family ATPase [Thermodesulfobacteriota bacterium]
MELTGGYQLLEQIHGNKAYTVYRAKRQQDGRAVVVKVLSACNPSQSDIARFTQEYEIIKNINDIDGIIAIYELVRQNGSMAIVMEDLDAISLKQFINGTPLPIPVFLEIATTLADILGRLHQKNIIHKDIKPHNILINADTRKIKLTDFGISKLITQADEAIYSPDVIEGTLKYISPEQTGRMNRRVDYRTDLYSLGITFYEMLTGGLPFAAADPMELIHAHMARPPVPLATVNNGIPVVLSEIVQKLMAKSAEDRYQNAFGLLHDLTRCRETMDENGNIPAFDIGTRDMPLLFTLPHIFVGRKAEKKQLLAAFDRCVAQTHPEIAIVSGHPGIGKTFLINEIHKPITEKRGYFIAAKYDKLGKDLPYSAIIRAFNSLVKQILAEGPERIALWQNRIQSALGNTGRLVVDVIPMLSLIIGDTPEVPALKPEDARNRFLYVFKNFIRVFTKPQHPLVLFLDDLQWADYASLHFIESVLSDADNGALFFIGAYRHKEIDDTHPLNNVLTVINQSHIPAAHYHIGPLSQPDIQHYLARFFRVETGAVKELAKVVETKTRGNPFFINQFLKTLYEKNMVRPDETGTWSWDLTAINTLRVTDNVIELMAEKIVELPETTRETLMRGACIGNTFNLEILAAVMETHINAILDHLSPALNAGMIYFSGDKGAYLHDRIQEAAYSLIPAERRSGIHLAIGRYMLQHIPAEDHAAPIFEIANHLNAGRAEISPDAEREEILELAKINVIAGRRARNAAAYEPAYVYLKAGISLLRETDWQDHYDLAYDLHIYAAELAYVNGLFTEMEAFLEAILARTSRLVDKARVDEIRIQAFSSRNMLDDAVKTTKSIMPLLGVVIPDPITGDAIMEEFARTDEILADKTDDDILGTPLMTDPNDLATIRVATSAAAPLYTGGYTNEIIIMVLKMMQLSLQKGIAPQTPYWFSTFAMTFYGLNQFERAFRFADLALSIKNRFPEHRGVRADMLVYTFIAHWQRPLHEVASRLMETYKHGLEAGDIEYAHLSIGKYTFLRLAGGVALDTVKSEIALFHKSMTTYKMLACLSYEATYAQFVENLMGNAENPAVLEGEMLSESERVPKLVAAQDHLSLCKIYLIAMILAYLFGDSKRALAKAEECKQYTGAISGGMHHIVHFYFYRSLARLAAIEDQPQEAHAKMFPKIDYAQDKLRVWAAFVPETIQHKIDLVAAEKSRLQGDAPAAAQSYENAINGAKKAGFVQELALAYELAAVFYKQYGFENFARLYMQNAIACYNQWGARAKAEQLMKTYGHIFPSFTAQPISTFDDTVTITRSATSQSTALDISTVIKASQTISGEIELDNLLRQLLHISIENAGAQKGALIFVSNGGLFVEAISDIKGTVDLTESLPLNTCDRLPASVIHYVNTTDTPLVIDDAESDNQFGMDPYITSNQVKSIMCAPVKHQKKISAILYMENNLSTHAFTPERLELLTILSAQAAISLENARLFKAVSQAKEEIQAHRDHLEEMVEERTRELRAAQAELVDNAHRAGMADIAVGVLHNVGNVLNSVRTSIYSMNQILTSSKSFEGFDKAHGLLAENFSTIDDFIANDPKGKVLLQYYLDIGNLLKSDRTALTEDLDRLEEKTEIITGIIAAQQSYASARSLSEELDVSDIVNDALTMMGESINSHHVTVTKNFAPVPPVMIEKTKLIHIMINILRNAMDAMIKTTPDKRGITINVYAKNSHVQIETIDTGEGIAPENLNQIFAHGFTTKNEGHGFGLHTSANYMTEMGGRMWAESDGPGKGSMFVLEFPEE